MRAHPLSTHARLVRVRPAKTRYEIRIRGSLSERLLCAFPGLTARVRDGVTLLEGDLPDQPALYGVLEGLESLGIELLGVERVSRESSGSDDDRSSGPRRR